MKTVNIKGQAKCLTTRRARGTVWSCLSPDEIELFNQNVSCRIYEEGDVIFYEGDDCTSLYLVESGLVAVKKTDTEGQQILIRLANPGDTLGYRPLLAGESHRASAEVIKKTKVCALPKSTMKRFLLSNLELGTEILKRMAKVLGEADERFFEAVSLPARIRLIHLLMVLQERCGKIVDDGSLLMELPLTRRDIAAMLGIRAESLSRLVHDIEDEGLIHFSGNKIIISRPETLLKELDAGLLSL